MNKCENTVLIPTHITASIALVVTPLEVVKIRQQASFQRVEVVVLQQSKSTEKLEAKSVFRGRGTTILRNGLHLPTTSFSCSVAPGRIDSLSHSFSRRINVCPRFYESTLAGSESPVLQQISCPTGSTVTMLRYILRNEGVYGLYTGLRPTLLMTVPNTAITLTLYEEIMHSRLNLSTNTPVYKTLLAGAVARCIASTITLPLELIRTRQASFMSSNATVGSAPGLVKDFRYLLQIHGISGLYKGLPVTLVRDSSFSGIYFLCLERFREKLKGSYDISGGNCHIHDCTPIPPSTTIMHNLISGAAAASIATLLTGPLDTAKTRRQMIHKEGSSNLYSNTSMLELIRKIYKHEGINGLWKGNKARMTKVVPASAIMIACYEIGKDVVTSICH